MTIECYFDACPHHGVHSGDEGPFCYEEECKATDQEIKWFGHIRNLEQQLWKVEHSVKRESDSVCEEVDGCPTEMAVLKRFWRETMKAQHLSVGATGSMPGTSGFTMAAFEADKVPVGTKLYTRPLSDPDGERYRWLAEDCDGDDQDDFIRWLAGTVATKEEIDAKIDEARDRKK